MAREMPKVPGFGRRKTTYSQEDTPGPGNLLERKDQAVSGPGTLQVEGTKAICGCRQLFVHPTNICEAPSVCQTLSPNLRIRNSMASFTGSHSDWGEQVKSNNLMLHRERGGEIGKPDLLG